jgi:uncharacterized protein YndB with AHSA1/START domain
LGRQLCADVHFDDIDAARLWDAVGRTDQYMAWWPRWIREFDVKPIEVGATSTCRLRPYLPYDIRLHLEVTDIDPYEYLRVTIAGDLTGHAAMTLTPAASGGCHARFCWQLDPQRPALAALERLLGPIADIGVRRMLELGLRAFRRRLSDVAPA